MVSNAMTMATEMQKKTHALRSDDVIITLSYPFALVIIPNQNLLIYSFPEIYHSIARKIEPSISSVSWINILAIMYENT